MPDSAFPQTYEGMVAALEFVGHEVVGVSDEVKDRVVLVAGEVLANAVEHGGEHPEVMIRVGIHRAQHQLELTIEEPHSGVDAERLAGSELPEDPLALSGRGLFLIRSLADDVQPSNDRGLRYSFRPRGDS